MSVNYLYNNKIHIQVELAVQLFSRVVDTHNIDLVLRELTVYESACMICRVGILNVFNPLRPEGPICLGERRYMYIYSIYVIMHKRPD